MKPWLLTPYSYKAQQGERQVLSVYLAEANGLRAADLDSDIVAMLQEIGLIDAIHFVGHGPQVEAARAAITNPDEVFGERVRHLIGERSPERESGLLFFTFDSASGSHRCTDSQGGTPSNESAVIASERNRCLMAMFLRSGGEERAPVGTHYAKTSERHCDRFLRVSNVVEEGNNVRLLAFWLLPSLWSIGTSHLVVDTSGIYSVALSALEEISRLGGLPHLPRVWSHRSHEGVGQITEDVAKDATFLISASTSSGLLEKLVARGAKADRITTLFSLSNSLVDGHKVLCDLRKKNAHGLDPIENHDASSCKWCNRHYHLISIQGDQFSIAPPRVKAVEIRAADLETKARSALSSLVGLKAFYAYRRRDGGRLCSLGMDVTPILSGEVPAKAETFIRRVRDKWESMLRRAKTLSLRNIVTCTYPKSDEVADDVLRSVAASLQGPTDIQLVASAGLSEVEPKEKTSTIVLSAGVDESQELLAVSRALRDVQEGGTTTYLAVAQLLAPKPIAERLKSNLTFGAQGADTFSYFCALDLPVECYDEASSWADELTALKRLRSWADEKEIDAPPELEARIKRLGSAPAAGLVDDLFWPDSNGHPLRLRSDFTLLDGDLKNPAVSQADLYAVIRVVLTGLRHSTNAERRLVHNAYERSVLSPSNFDRFNDGILQACLLRASRPRELAFGSCDERLSEQMLHLLDNVLPSSGRPEKAEALVEFLLALMTGHMTLTRPHLNQFLDKVEATTHTWPIAALMASYLRDARILDKF